MTALSADTGTAGDFITNVASQTVSGTFTGALGAGEKIQVSANGGTTWVDATVGPGSSWSASGVTLSAGTGTLLVQSIDTAGNATAGTRPQLYAADQRAERDSDSDGAERRHWRSRYNLKVTVTDLAGNANTTTNAQTLIVDATPPSAVATVTALSADTGTAGDFITNVASQTVSGTFTGALGAGEKIQVSANGGTTWVDATVGPGSSWSASGVTLSAGTGTLLVQSIDTAGNATAGTGHSYTLQTSGPSAIATVTALSADTGASGSDFITNVASQTVSGTFTGTLGAGEKIQVSADGGTTWVDATVGPGSSWSASGVTLSAGAGTLSVRSIDAANNTTAGTGHSYTLDATPPSETFPTVTLTSDTGASNADFITSSGGVHFAGTVADTGGAGIASVQVFNGATLLGTATVVGGNWSLDTTLAAGTYNNLKVTVTDLAGNANTTTNAQTLIVDATPPSAVATVTALSADTGTAGDFITNVASQTVSGTFTGALGAGEKIQVSANGGTTWVDATVGPGSSWSASGVTLSAGTGTLLVQSIDTAGNATAGTGHSYTLQTSGPSAIATVTALSADTGASGSDFITNVASQTVSGTFTGTLGAGEKIQVSADGGTTWVDATVGPGSSWSASGVTLSAGAGTLSVRSIDAANNTTAGTGHSYTLDATPPSETFPTVTLTSDTGASNADFITSNGGVHFAGTVADTGGAGIASVQVFNGATLLGTATVVGGNWSLDTTLAAGTYNNLKVTVTDLAGNANTTTNAQTLIVDATPPSETFPTVTLTSDTGASNADFITSNGGVHFAGTVADTGGAGIASVQVFNGATLLGTATVVGGNWSLDTTLAAGTYNNLKVTVTDLAGNANTTTNAQTLIVDATPPSETFPTVTLTSDTGASNADFITSNGGVHFAGTVADTGGAGIASVQVFNGATLLGTATVVGGNWSLDTTLAAGTYNNLKVTVTDLAGNANTTTNAQTLIVDATPPSAVATVTALSADTGTAGDFITNVASQTVSGTFTGALGAGEKIQVSANGGTTWVDATVGPGSSWSASGVTLSAGTGTLLVQSIDTAGNATAGTGHGYTLQTSGPSAIATVTALSADTGASGSDFITNVASQTVSGTFTGALGAGEKIQVSADGGTTWVDATVGPGSSWSASGVTLSAGAGTLSVRSIDAANNTTAGTGHSYTLDATPPSETFPTVTLTSDTGASNADFITSSGGVHFAGTVADTGGAGIASVQVFNGATLLGTATVVGGNWSLDTTLAAGTYNNLKVTVTDLAGNANTTTNAQTLIVDATPPSETFPTVTLTSDTGASNADFITSNGGVHFAGTVADTGGAGIASVQVFNGATLLGTATVVGGNWSLDTTLAAGTYNNLKVTVTDLAGNANTTTNAQTLIVDATPPAEALAITAITTDTGTVGDFITSDTTLTVSGSNGALAAGEKIQVSSDGTNWFDATPIDSTHWSYDDTATSHTSSFSYRARIVDIAGNIGTTASQAITIDTHGAVYHG